MLQAINQLDHKISKPIIMLDNLIVSIILYPFAAFFHPRLIFLAYISVYQISGKDSYTTVVYLIGTGICLVSTTILKKITKRARPTLIIQSKKPHSFRKKQKNNSMPSGDAIQSALFVAYLYCLGVPISYVVLFHIGVCLGRVYYMCHWIMDTVVSTFLGSFIGLFLNQIRLNKTWEPLFNSITAQAGTNIQL